MSTDEQPPAQAVVLIKSSIRAGAMETRHGRMRTFYHVGSDRCRKTQFQLRSVLRDFTLPCGR